MLLLITAATTPTPTPTASATSSTGPYDAVGGGTTKVERAPI